MQNIDISPEVRNRIGEYHLPAYSEIPDIGLFLEQTTKFVAGCLEPLEGISITGSMISNYVKMKLIANPVKKQYYREQIADIIFVALVKSVLSLEETEKMLRLRRSTYDARAAYEYFCTEFRRVLGYVFGLEPEPEAVDGNAAAEKELLRKVVTAAAYKVYLNEVFREVE